MAFLKRKYQCPVSYLQEALDYDPETGRLSWKLRPAYHFKSDRGRAIQRGKANSEAFTAVQSAGYACGIIDRVQYLKHRVVWAIHTGEWPPEDMVIDHIDGDRLNNRISNLRCVTQQENSQAAVDRRRGRAVPRKPEKRISAGR